MLTFVYTRFGVGVRLAKDGRRTGSRYSPPRTKNFKSLRVDLGKPMSARRGVTVTKEEAEPFTPFQPDLPVFKTNLGTKTGKRKSLISQ
jgi:hypothetical protein